MSKKSNIGIIMGSSSDSRIMHSAGESNPPNAENLPVSVFFVCLSL